MHDTEQGPLAREARIEAGVSKEELASFARREVSWVSRCERGLQSDQCMRRYFNALDDAIAASDIADDNPHRGLDRSELSSLLGHYVG